MNKSIKAYIDRLTVVLQKPRTENIEGYAKELHVHLGKYSWDELQESITILLKTQKSSYWPTVGAMIVAAEEARAQMRKRTEVQQPLGRVRRLNSIGEWYTPRTASEDEAYWSKEAFDEADKLVQSELGRKAADEGWIGDLYDFCRENRRLPQVKEQYSLKTKSKKTDQEFAEARPGSSDHRMMAGALNRRDAFARVAYGKAQGWKWQEQNQTRIANAAGAI